MPPVRATALLVLALLAATDAALARRGEPPYSLATRAKLARVLPVTDLAPMDAPARRLEIDAAERIRPGPHPKRRAVADPRDLVLAPRGDGVWDALPDGSQLWRAQVRVAGATDLRLAFRRYALPRGATLHVIGADGDYQGPYTSADGSGEFHLPVVPGDTATLELRVPAAAWPLADEALELGRIGAGFRDVFAREPIDLVKLGSPGRSGSCNVDVACPAGQPYADQSRAVAYYEFVDDEDSRWYLCTGTLLNNTARDRRNVFLTAAHCVDSATEAASMVLYWNYQSTSCNVLAAPAGGFFGDSQTGAALRATRTDVDMSLVELHQAPQPEWNAYYAGWDATGAMPAGTVSLHHPSGDVKKITTGPAPSTDRNCILDAPIVPDTHWLAGPYAEGTTEGGSSGSALFVRAGSGQKRVVGTLSGGGAECRGTQPNAATDCYGRVSAAWDGPQAGARLRDWLDPAGTGARAIDGLDARAPAFEPPRRSPRAVPPILRQRPPRR